MNSAAEFFLEIILKHRQALRQSFELTIKDRNEFAAKLKDVPAADTVFSSGGNFILLRLKSDKVAASHLTDRLLSEHAVYVKDISSKFADKAGYLRLAVRTAEENRRLVELMKGM
jgi:histidinol-phosphate/aromatic aminotransferase/cobyric acid decarboxylase-like protein